jgi:transposase-like protein
MNTTTLAAEYRLQQWAVVIKDCKESGLSIRKYCKNAGIHENTYYYWQKKLRETIYKEITTEQSKITGLLFLNRNEELNQRQELREHENLTPAKWARVDTNNLSSAETGKTNSIKISRDGWTVTIESNVDTHLLTETLRAVSRACC